MCERATFKSIVCISISPFNVFFSYLSPAVAADGYHLVLVLDVHFNVRVVAFAIPRILARLSHLGDHRQIQCCDAQM